MSSPAPPAAPADSTEAVQATRGLYARWLGLLSRHRLLVTLILACAAALLTSLSARIRWQPDVLTFFSSDSLEVQNIRRSVQERGPANHLRLDIHAAPGATVDRAALRQAAQWLAEELRRTGLFREVWDGVPPARLGSAYSNLVRNAPIFLDDPSLRQLDGRLSLDYLAPRFTTVARQLIDPDGEVLLRQAQADPLNLGSLLAEQLRALAPSAGATIDDGMLVSGDGRHIMLILDPLSLPSDQQGAQQVIDGIGSAVESLRASQPGIEVWTIGAHRAYVENARQVVRDVKWVSAIGSIAVLLIIAGYFRRWSSVVICFIPPAMGLAAALGICGACGLELPLILLGFGGLICGYTTDYGLQLIAACHRRATSLGEWRATVPAMAVREMLGPISMSVATSITAFGTLALSNSSGLRSLGLFVAGTTAAIWMLTFLVLPVYLGPWVLRRGAAPPARSARLWQRRAVRMAVTLAFVGIVGAAVWHAGGVKFNSDPRRLDGSSQAMRDQEAAFYSIWGDQSSSGVVVLEQSDPDALLTLLHRVDRALAELQADGMVQSYASGSVLLPDPQTVRARRQAWSEFCSPQRRARAAELVFTAVRQAGFKSEAWQPWADRLSEPPPELSSRQLLSQSPLALFPGAITGEGTRLSIVVRMKKGLSARLATAWANELRLRFPSLTIVCGHALMFDANERARAEAETLSPLLLLAILLPLWLYFRRLSLAFAASLCLIIGLAMVLGAAAAWLGGLNLLCLVPVLFTLGVAIDYGIYVASAAGQLDADRDARTAATTRCALTSVLGMGGLVLAGHPVLRWLGITLIAGVAGGYLAALLIVGPLAARLRRPKRRGWMFVGLRLAGRAALTAILLVLAIVPLGQWIMVRQAPEDARPLPATALVQSDDDHWQIGQSWLRRREGIWELRLGGSPEEMGHAIANLAGPFGYRMETEMLDRLDTMLPSIWARWLVTRGVGVNMLSLPEYIPPAIRREIYANARAYRDPNAYLAPTYPRLLSYHALHDVSQMLIDNPLLVSAAGACTGVVSLPGFSGDGHLWMARNFDFEAGQTFGRHKSVTYCHPDDGFSFVSIAWPGFSGCITGMNSQRLALFMNAGATAHFRRIGVPTVILARQILQHARTIDQALAIIREAPVFVSDAIVLADGKTGQARVVEKSPGGTADWAVTRSAVVANHFVSPQFRDDALNRDRMARGTTVQRYNRAAELLTRLEGRVDQASLAALLRDKKGVGDADIGLGNRNAIDSLIACHSVIMDVTAGRMWVAAWPHASGRFVYIDAMDMLEHGSPDVRPDPSMDLPPDAILCDGRYDRFLAARAAEEEALAALSRNDAPAAAERARFAIENNPRFYRGHELLGRALLMQSDKLAAESSLREALALSPPYAQRREMIEELLRQCAAR